MSALTSCDPRDRGSGDAKAFTKLALSDASACEMGPDFCNLRVGTMSLARRGRRHETLQAQAVQSSDYWDFAPDQHVMTVDGIGGVVTAVLDGPFPGNETYEVVLDDGLGGGQYTASQLSSADRTTASVDHTAADDYPELGSILSDRPDPALQRYASQGGGSPFGREAVKGPQLSFEHEEEYNGGSRRPDTHTLHGVHPETGDRVGWLKYDVPRRKADKIYVQRMEVGPEHKGNGYAGQLMDEMQRRHPNTPIDHGDRTNEGNSWWESYTKDKPVRRGRTMAARAQDDDAAGSGGDVVEPAEADDAEDPTGQAAPASCSYCGATDFTDLTDNGRSGQATCAVCGGTMSSAGGTGQWTPELIGDPSNHPKGNADPASGGVGGAAGASDPLIRDQSRMAGRYERTSPTGWHYDTSISGRTKVTSPSGETSEHYNDLMGNGIKQHRHHEDMPVPLYHGMNRPLEGEQIEPGRPGNFVKRMKHVYMTEDPNTARHYAGPRGKVYEVHPTGWYGHRSDAKGADWASEHPLNIVREVPHHEAPGYDSGTSELKQVDASIREARALFQQAAVIPSETCGTCKGKGTVSWSDEDPDWRGDPDENPGKVHTAHCDDCNGKGVVQPISDEEIARHKKVFDNERAKSLAEHIAEQHPAGKEVTYDDVKSCSPRCPVGREWSRQHRGQLQVTALSWDEIGDRHPHVYGDSEIHGDAADSADGPGIGNAANYLAHERPGHQDAEDSSVHDLDFREETVHPRHIDYSPSGASDHRVMRAREGYANNPEQVPPLVLVKRHNVYQVADGHHRAEAAHVLGVPVRAYVADSPHHDEPFADGERAPFHRAEPIPTPVSNEHDLRTHMTSDHGYSSGQMSRKSDHDLARFHDQEHFDCPAEFRAKMGSLHHVAAPEDDEHVQQKMGLPLLKHGESYEERRDKLTSHYTFLHNDNGGIDEPYTESRHPLASHHEEHGVPHFEVNSHLEETPEVKARIAGQLSQHLIHLPVENRPSVSVSTPRYDGSMEENTTAYFSPERNRIGVHRDLARSDEHNPRVDGMRVPRGYVARHDDTPLSQHVLTHESGHALDYHMHQVPHDDPYGGNEKRSDLLNKVAGAIPGATPYKHGTDKYRWMLDNKEHFINHVGTYAATDPSELIGELYAQHHHHPNPSPAARVVGQHLEGASDDDRSTHAGEAGNDTPRAGAEGMDAGDRRRDHENRDPARGDFRGRLFARKLTASEEDYRMQHQAPDADYGAPLHDVEGMMPGFHEHPEYFKEASLTPVETHEMVRLARKDSEFGFHVIATWADVRNKAKRIRREGGVTIKVATNQGLAGNVQGDHGQYESMITYRPGTQKIADWKCGCKWGDWAFQRVRFYGRQCSHSLALQYEAQSRGMFGKEIKLGSVAEFEPRPIEVLASALVEVEDPGDVMKLLMAFGLQHSGARQVLDDALGRTAAVPWDHEHNMDCHEYGCPHEDDNDEEPRQDWDHILDGVHEIHRGVGVLLHPSIHRIVHDESRPAHERAHLLLREIAKGDPETRNRWSEKNIGTHWTTEKNVAEDFAERHNSGEVASGKNQSKMIHQKNHMWGTEDDGTPEGQPSTAVVIHAKPDVSSVDHDPNPMAHGSGEIYDHNAHGEREVPYHPGASVEVKGISWKPVHEYDDHEYTRHDFHEPQFHQAAKTHMCPHCGAEVGDDDRTCPRCGERLTADVPEMHEAKRKKKHDTNDARRHAPQFGYGVPGWGLPIGWCPQCGGSGCGHCGGNGQVVQAPVSSPSTTADPVPDQNGFEGQMMSGGISETASLGGWLAAAEAAASTPALPCHAQPGMQQVTHMGGKGNPPDGPTVSGVALKAADTGRILMLQRGINDPKDQAGGTWEFPGGHHEDGDTTSLHAGIREFQEEVGQPFPEGGVVHHTWTSPNGIYQGHVVVVPSEKDALSTHEGRTVANPDDPGGDDHEQCAWWEVEHARKNPALREELKKNTPWREIAKAGETKTAAAWDSLSGMNPQPGRGTSEPGHSTSQNPASTGFLTAQDPASWDELNTRESLAPDMAYDGILHEQPEAALPSTDGAVEDDFVGMHEIPDTHSEISGLDESMTPNSYHGAVARAAEAAVEAPSGVSSIVARFQASAAAQGIMAGSPEPAGEGGNVSFNIAAAAREHLSKSALKDFTHPEQQALINEGKREGTRARNFGDLQIEGTHYQHLQAALGLDEADSEDLFT